MGTKVRRCRSRGAYLMRRHMVFSLSVLLLLSGCGATSVTFVNATPEDVAEAIVAEGGTADEHALFRLTHKHIWPKDFRLTMLSESASATWTLDHFLLTEQGTDSVRVEPQTIDRCQVRFRSGIKRYGFMDLLPKLFYSRNVERERTVIMHAWWRLLEKNPWAYAVATDGWQPPKPPEFTVRDGVWIAFKGSDVKSAAGLLLEKGFAETCRGRDRRQFQRRLGGYRGSPNALLSSLEGAVVKRCGDTVVVGLAYKGWRVTERGHLFDLDTTEPLDDDYGRKILQDLAETLAVRLEQLRFVSAEDFIEPITLPPEGEPKQEE